MCPKYEEHVAEALRDVNNGQHLRFINLTYRTKDVCLAAVKYEASHNRHSMNDFYSVPIGNIDYVYDQMKEFVKDDEVFLKLMDEIYKERTVEKDGTYGEFKTYQEMLDHYNATCYDDLLLIRFKKIIAQENKQ